MGVENFFKKNVYIFLICLLIMNCSCSKADVVNDENLKKDNSISMQSEMFILPNKMRVLVMSDPQASLVAHYVFYDVGGLNDFHGKAGIAHFLEHLMFKDTKNNPEGTLINFLNSGGASFNAGTGYELTVYYETLAPELLERIMELEADRMQNVIFDEKKINTERDVIKEERMLRVDNTIDRAFLEKLSAIHYNNVYYGASLIGSMNDLDNIKMYDLENFYKQYYDPSNAILVLSGNVSIELAKELAQKYYGVLPNRVQEDFFEKTSIKIDPKQLIADKIEKKFELAMTSEKVKSPTYFQVFSAPTLQTAETGLKDGLAMELLNFLLKEGKGMLFSELLEKQKKVSNISISYNMFGKDYTPLLVKANTLTQDGLHDLKDDIINFFNNAKNLITDEMVRETARMLSIDYIYLMDDLEDRAEILGELALVKEIKDPHKFMQNLVSEFNKITAADLHILIDKVFINGYTCVGRLYPANEMQVKKSVPADDLLHSELQKI